MSWHRSLSARFFLRSAFTILALVAVILWVARNEGRRQALASAQSGVRVSAEIMKQSLASQARTMEAGLEVFTGTSQNLVSVERQDFAQVRDALLRNLSTLKSDVAMVIRPSGALLSCTTDGFKQDYSDVGIVELASHPEEAAQAGHPGPSYEGFFKIDGGTYKGTYFGAARRLQAGDGAFLGVMVVANRLNDGTAAQLRRQSTARLAPSDPESQVTLLGGSEILGTTLPSDAVWGGLVHWLATPPVKAALASFGTDGISQPLPLQVGGQDHLGVLVDLGSAGGGSIGLRELVSTPLEPFLRPFRELQRAIVVAGLAALLVALLLSLSSARKVTGPLGALTRATAELAKGGRPVLPPVRQKDEVGALTQAFHILLEELKAKEELLMALDGLRGAKGEALESSGPASPDPDATEFPASRTAVSMNPSRALSDHALQALRPGALFAGRYRIDRALAKGGMGVVMKALDTRLDEPVALKVLRPEFASDPGFLERLKQEIKLARRITHRHVLRTHDFGDEDGTPYVTMEYLEGVSLRELLDDRKQLPLSMALRIGRQVAEGLQAAHAEGVVHRDIKPANVMFDARGDAKIMDFGIALPARSRSTDGEGQIFGTPRYMAPEQALGEPVDPRTDLYSLGVMLFELVTGSAPFEAKDSVQVLRKHITEPPPEARTFNRALPPDFNLLLLGLMAKAKEARPASAAEVLGLLRRIQEGGREEANT